MQGKMLSFTNNPLECKQSNTCYCIFENVDPDEQYLDFTSFEFGDILYPSTIN